MTAPLARTVSFAPRWREREGFGCPFCGEPLPSDAANLRRVALAATDCCGYDPTPGEARRWALAGQALGEADA